MISYYRWSHSRKNHTHTHEIIHPHTRKKTQLPTNPTRYDKIGTGNHLRQRFLRMGDFVLSVLFLKSFAISTLQCWKYLPNTNTNHDPYTHTPCKYDSHGSLVFLCVSSCILYNTHTFRTFTAYHGIIIFPYPHCICFRSICILGSFKRINPIIY